jgi:zeaxanthin glucosyltransferase
VRIGVVVPELMGHLNPAIELARELEAAGHYAIVLTRLPGADRAARLGVCYSCYGWGDTPGREELCDGSLVALAKYLRAANEQLLFGADYVCDHLELDALVIDETLQGACLVAARRGIPYATFCAALPMAYDPAVPPPIFAWQPARSWLGRLRDKAGWAYFAWVFRHVLRDLERYRKEHGIPLFDAEGRSVYVGRAQAAQLPPELDFPRQHPAPFLGTGAWVTRDQEEVDFPWWWLDGRPLHYVCMGTILNGPKVAREIGDAVEWAALQGAQVVVSTGGQEPAKEALGGLRELYARVRERHFDEETYGARDVLVVRWAPHHELIERAAMVVTHCGMNTALAACRSSADLSLWPQAFDQPGVAARILFASARGAL